MNKAQVQFEKCKRIASDNVKCTSILLKLIDKGREDILDHIIEFNKNNVKGISPEGVIKLYVDKHEDIDLFIQAYDSMMNIAKDIRKNYYNEYEKGMEDSLKR